MGARLCAVAALLDLEASAFGAFLGVRSCVVARRAPPTPQHDLGCWLGVVVRRDRTTCDACTRWRWDVGELRRDQGDSMPCHVLWRVGTATGRDVV